MKYDCIRLPILTAGKEVYYKGQKKVIEYNILAKGILYVKLFNVYDIIDSKYITCSDSVFEFQIIDGRIIAKT